MKSQKKKVEFTLPWPPSVNERLGHNKRNKRMYLSRKFKDYFLEADSLIRKQLKFKNKKITEGVNSILIFTPPDNRVRDNDNYPKAVNDAIKYAKVIQDDSLFKDTLLKWNKSEKPGSVKIKIGNFKFKAVYDDGTVEEIE